MLLFLAISTCVLILFMVLHFHHHFRFTSCTNTKKDESNRVNCICITKDNVDFDFFPICFLCYIFFMVSVSVLIILKLVFVDEETYTFYIPNIHNQTFKKVTKIGLSSRIDWCIYFLTLFAMIWESLFSFYRYYTTMISYKHFYSPTLIQIMQPFSIYTIIFILLFLIQTQIYYYIFPVILTYYLGANIFWVLTVCNVLIASFSKLEQRVSFSGSYIDFRAELINNAKLIRNLSIVSTLLSSIYITLFLVVYDMKIAYYFPLIWSLYTPFFALNFVRNRQFFAKLRYAGRCPCISRYKFKQTAKQMAVLLDVPTKSAAAATQLQPKPSKEFIVCIENVDQNKEQSANNSKLSKSTSDIATIYHTPISLPVHTKKTFLLPTKNKKSFSTGNLKSLLTNKSQNQFPNPSSPPNTTSNDTFDGTVMCYDDNKSPQMESQSNNGTIICYDKSNTKSPPTVDLYGVDTPNTMARTPYQYAYDSPNSPPIKVVKLKINPISKSANPAIRVRSTKPNVENIDCDQNAIINTPLSVDIELQKPATLHVPSPFDGKNNVRSHRAASNPETGDNINLNLNLNRQPSEETLTQSMISMTREYDFSLMIEEIPQTPMPIVPHRISMNAPKIKLPLELIIYLICFIY